MKSDLRSTMKFYPNSSLFSNELDVRYFKTTQGEKQEIIFSVVSMKKNPVLKSVISFCEEGKTIGEVIDYLKLQYDLELSSLFGFVNDMIDEEILVSEYKPNVLGSGFIEKIFDIPNINLGLMESAHLEKLFYAFRGEYQNNLDSLVQVEEELKKRYPVSDDLKSIYYCISERKPVQGGLSSQWQKKILDGLSCLMHLTRPGYSEELDKFKRAFLLRYEGKQMPLLEVLDPQLGIGYGGLDQINDSLGLIEYLNIEMTGSGGQGAGSGSDEALSIILRDWFASNSSHSMQELVIAEEQIQKLASSTKGMNLPPSISVIFRICDDKVVIEDAGNCTANALISRFSCSSDIAEFCKELSTIEQQHNPEVIFAEISHICNLHTANINQRDYIRDYEIPVLTQSGLPKNQQINLADLTIEVVNDTIILWSTKLKKIIQPRLSTAFNFTKNQFPVFRFLCDLQSQHLQPNLYFDIQGLLPGLKFYPRIRYKDAILQLAEWHFSSDDFSEILSAPKTDQLSLFDQFREREHLPRFIAYCFHDNYLVYDLDNTTDKSQLLAEIKNKVKLIFKEFPYLLNATGTVKNQEGQPLLTQFVASLYKEEPVYKYELAKQARPTRQKSIADTRDWIYFKIYCHSLSMDAIIAESIIPAVKKAVNDGLIYEWFWLRYQDPEPHIRLRVMPSKNMYGASFELINRLLNKLYQMKLVNRFHTDQYKRELERYSPELILQVEKIFFASSLLVTSFLKQKLKYNWSDQRVLTEAVVSVRMILKSLQYTKEDKLEFCTKLFEQFYTEFNKPKGLKPIVEKVNKLITDNVTTLIQDSRGRQSYALLDKNLAALALQHRLKRVKSVSLESLAADIIHMHLNRIFTTNQRYFEMITYYLAKRNLQTELNKAAITG